jgi:hypothetical protein
MPFQAAAQSGISPALPISDDLLVTNFLHFVVGGSAVRDSNLFKTPVATEETYRTGYLGLRVDKQYSQQRFQVNVTKTTYNYNHLTYLNYKALDYLAAWQGTLTSRLSASFSADRTESQVPYYDFVGVEKNIRVSENQRLNLDGGLGYGLHLLLGAWRTTQRSTVPFAAQADYRITYGELGLKYVASPLNTFSFIYRNGRGKYYHRDVDVNVELDNGFRQREYEVQHNAVLSGRSSLTGRLTALERRHDHFSQLDSSGWGGSVDYNWNPTDKLGGTLSARRNLTPSFDLHTTHRIDKALSVTPRWQITTKTTATLFLARTKTEYLGEGFAIGTTGEQRQDHYNQFDFNLAWLSARFLSLTAGYQYIQRRSNDQQFVFDARIARVGASLTF